MRFRCRRARRARGTRILLGVPTIPHAKVGEKRFLPATPNDVQAIDVPAGEHRRRRPFFDGHVADQFALTPWSASVSNLSVVAISRANGNQRLSTNETSSVVWSRRIRISGVPRWCAPRRTVRLSDVPPRAFVDGRAGTFPVGLWRSVSAHLKASLPIRTRHEFDPVRRRPL